MDERAPVAIEGIFTQPYNEIVKPGRVWTINKYFLRRWTPYLSPSQVWLIIGARQLSYFNRRRPWFEAYDGSLAAAAGLNVKVFRRTIKRAVVEGVGHVATFLSRQREPAYQRQGGVTRQTQSRYTIRLDDPLTPGDSEALAYWLRRHSPIRVTPDSVKDCLVAAQQHSAQELWSEEPGPHSFSEGEHEPATGSPGLHAVADVVRLVFPGVATSAAWHEAADALHSHLVAPELAHFETQYFRRRWLPLLGPGPALLLTHLRSLCFHNEATGETRDHVRLASGELETLFQISSRTLRRWFSRLEQASETLPGERQLPLYRALESVKQSNQKVMTHYWINLKTPVAPEDWSAYQRLLALNSDNKLVTHNGDADRSSKAISLGAIPFEALSFETSSSERVTDKKLPTQNVGDEQKVPHTTKGGGQNKPHTNGSGGQEVPHTNRGDRHNEPHTFGGGGQLVPGSKSKRAPNKYYKTLCEALKTPELYAQLNQAIHQERQQEQHDSQIIDGTNTQSLCSLAAVAANGSLTHLLVRMGVQEPSRSAICHRQPALEDVVGWHLYASREKNLLRPLPYVIRRLLSGDPPPEPFAELAALTWAQWRTYAAAWQCREWLGEEGLRNIMQFPDFPMWCEYYADTPLLSLPFGVGEGLDDLKRSEVTTAGANGAALPAKAHVGADTIWREARLALRRQLDPATFNAWLREAMLVKREGELFVIGVHNEAAQEWVSARLIGALQRTLQALTAEPAEVQIVVMDLAEAE